MTPQAHDLLTAALRLAECERAELAIQLFESLDPDTDADADAAWEAEIGRRIQEIDEGKAQLIPWEEARRQILEDTDEPDPG